MFCKFSIHHRLYQCVWGEEIEGRNIQKENKYAIKYIYIDLLYSGDMLSSQHSILKEISIISHSWVGR